MENAAEALREIRIDLGLTQEEIAEPLGVGSAYVSQIENGVRSPSWKYVVNFARITKTPVLVLLRRLGMLDNQPADIEERIAALVQTHPEFADVFEFASDYPGILPELASYAEFLVNKKLGEEQESGSAEPRRRAATANTT